MNGHRLLSMIGALLLGVLPAGNANSAASDDKPNIVLIMADDVGYECFGCYGSKQYKTPRIDQMAAGGMRFVNCHSTPLCTPSRVKLMTGMDNIRNYCDFGVFPEGQTTFAELLRANGYRTGFAGKWQLNGGNKIYPKDEGFDDVCRLIGVWPKYWKTPIAINDKRLPVNRGEVYGPDIFTAFVTDFIQKNAEGDKPFLVYYPMTLVHGPIEPTPASEDPGCEDRQRNFEGMVAYMDTCIGRILDTLEETGAADNTIVIFTADNGTDRGLSSKLGGKVIPGGKGRTDDHGTHVPLIVTGPSVPAGKVCEDLIDFSDFFTTLADVAGADLPANLELDGRSFWPQCRGEEGNPREWLFNYYFPRPYSDRFDYYARHPEVRWVRTKRHKLYGDGRFYDLVEDVEEKTALPADQDAEVRAALQEVLDSMPSKNSNIDYENL